VVTGSKAFARDTALAEDAVERMAIVECEPPAVAVPEFACARGATVSICPATATAIKNTRPVIAASNGILQAEVR
jgi:hypothetical protein